VAPLAVYAVLGSSRQLSIGPESTTALMTAVTGGPLAAGGPARDAAVGAALGVLGGGVWLVGWGGGLGVLVGLLCRPGGVGVPAGADRLPGRRRRDHDRGPA